MRDVTTAMETALSRTDGQGFRLLLNIDAPGQATRYLCTDTREIDGTNYIGELLTASPMYESINTLTDMALEIFDNVENRNVVVLTAPVELFMWAVGTSLSDADLLFKGDICDPLVVSGGKIRFDAISRANRHDQAVGNVLSESDHPGADPDVVGHIMPVVYGSHTDHPCMPIDAGALNNLAEDIDKTVQTIPLSDASRFPSSGTIQISNEQITYTGKSDNSITGCTRGDNSTTAAAHQKGVQVGEVKTQYDYLVADHPVSSISNVKVDGVLQDGADFTLLTNDNGQAKIRFTTLPKLEKSIDIEVSGDIGVNSSTTATYSDAATTTNTTPIEVNIWDANGGRTDFEFANAAGSINGATVSIQGDIYSDFDNSPWWQIGTEYCYLRCQGLNESNNPIGITQTLLTIKSVKGSLSQTVFPNPLPQGTTFTALLAGDVRKVRMWWERTSGGANVFGLLANSVTISRGIIGAVNSTTTGGVSANSAADIVIGGTVTCDVDGHVDDASGTITGAPGTLLERPDHVVRHLLREYGQAPDTETNASDFDEFTGEVISLRVTSSRSVRELVQDIASQVNGLSHYSAGRWRFVQRPGPSPTPDITLTDANIVSNEDGSSTITKSCQGLHNIINRHEWRSGLQPGGGWAFTGIKDDSTSQNNYGLRHTQVDLPYVPTETQAQTHIDWRSAREADPNRKIIDLQPTLSAYRVEIGDIARINSTKTGVDITGEVVSISPRALSGQGAGSMQITVEQS